MISAQLVRYAEHVRWVLAAMLLLGWVLARRDARRVCAALTAFGALAGRRRSPIGASTQETPRWLRCDESRHETRSLETQ